MLHLFKVYNFHLSFAGNVLAISFFVHFKKKKYTETSLEVFSMTNSCTQNKEREIGICKHD